MAIASMYCDVDLAGRFLEKSRYFFEKSMKQLAGFGDNQYLTRPLVVMLTNGFAHMDVCASSRFRQDQEGAKAVRNEDVVTSGRPDTKNMIVRNFHKVLSIIRHTSLRKEISWIRSRLSSF